MKSHTKFLIVGGGPAGLGAAWRLGEHGQEDWLLVEAMDIPGGLASSVLDAKGFTWDLGGHVIFSHYTYFDNLLDDLLGDQWLTHKREASVWICDRYIPYPLQNNIWRLPKEELVDCVDDLLNLRHSADSPRPANFKEWIEQNYGQSLAKLFFIPYNWKVWAHKAEDMSSCWIGERVARVSINNIVRNIILQRDDIGWGPNAQFRFPSKGGTGAVWKALCDRLPEEKIKLKSPVESVDIDNKSVVLKNGDQITFEHMVSTIPINVLLQRISGKPELTAKSSLFKSSSSHIVGVGMNGPVPEALANKFWMYFPDLDVPFYRCTVFSNYSKFNVAEPGKQWSLLCEVSESSEKPVDHSRVVEDVLAGLRKTGLLNGDEDIESIWHKRLEYGYPVPFVGRDELLAEIEPVLKERSVYSRGRFGGWRYEVANQDHTMMQGVEVIDHILTGSEETTYFFPDVVNAGPKRAVPAILASTDMKAVV
jgi:protoporphyrinogen oxidase